MIGILGRLFDFVTGNPLGKLVAGSIGLLALVGTFALDQRSKGAAKVVQKVEKQNAAVQKQAGSAGRKSLDPRGGGVLNPYYRAD